MDAGDITRKFIELEREETCLRTRTSSHPPAAIADSISDARTAAKEFIALLQEEEFNEAVQRFNASMRLALPDFR
jgi:hypothetical protein